MKSKLLAATAAIGLLAGLSPPANASLLAQYSVNGGASFTTLCTAVSGSSCNFTGTLSNGAVLTGFSATSNSPGTPVNAEVLQATALVTNPTAANESFLLRVGDTGYTQPLAPPTAQLLNSIAGTVTVGGASNVFDSIGCLDPTNSQNLCPGGTDTPVIAANITAPGSGNNSNTVVVNALAAPFALSELLNITATPGTNFNFSASSIVEGVTGVSEPGTLAVVGGGLISLWFARRKRSKGSPTGFAAV